MLTLAVSTSWTLRQLLWTRVPPGCLCILSGGDNVCTVFKLQIILDCLSTSMYSPIGFVMIMRTAGGNA